MAERPVTKFRRTFSNEQRHEQAMGKLKLKQEKAKNKTLKYSKKMDLKSKMIDYKKFKYGQNKMARNVQSAGNLATQVGATVGASVAANKAMSPADRAVNGAMSLVNNVSTQDTTYGDNNYGERP